MPFGVLQGIFELLELEVPGRAGQRLVGADGPEEVVVVPLHLRELRLQVVLVANSQTELLDAGDDARVQTLDRHEEALRREFRVNETKGGRDVQRVRRGGWSS